MFDVLLVGAGLTNAVICSTLRAKHRVLVIDTRPHLGGLLYETQVRDTHIPQYGTWFLDEADHDVVERLLPFTRFSHVLHKDDGYATKLAPHLGWTTTMRQMFAGAEVVLGADADHWLRFAASAKHVVYTGRVDLLPWPDLDARFQLGSTLLSRFESGWLSYYDIRSQQFTVDKETAPIATDDGSRTYFHRRLTGGDSLIATRERRIPHDCVHRLAASPAGPEMLAPSIVKARQLKEAVSTKYPRILLGGHLALYQEQTIGECVRAACQLATQLQQ